MGGEPPKTTRKRWLGVLLCVAGWWAVGCDSPRRQAVLDAAAYPPDFTLVFFVKATAGAEAPEYARVNDPARRSAQHTVTPDRTLRAALGPGVSTRFHAPATARLTADEMAELYDLAEAAVEFEATLPAPLPAARPAVRYRFVLTAHGEPTEIQTTPDRNPAAADLLARLIQLRGGR